MDCNTHQLLRLLQLREFGEIREMMEKRENRYIQNMNEKTEARFKINLQQSPNTNSLLSPALQLFGL